MENVNDNDETTKFLFFSDEELKEMDQIFDDFLKKHKNKCWKLKRKNGKFARTLPKFVSACDL